MMNKISIRKKISDVHIKNGIYIRAVSKLIILSISEIKTNQTMDNHNYRYAQSAPQQKQMHYSPNLLSTLNNAIDNSLLSTIEYDSRDKGVTLRNVEPMAIVYKERKRNLVAYCHLRNEYRAFRLDRLNMIKVKQENFNRRNDLNLSEFQDDPSASYHSEENYEEEN